MTILAACSPGEVRTAALDDSGTLLDYAIWRPGRPDGAGDVHRGRVGAVMPALAGVFVALQTGDGFLPDSAGGAGLGVGDMVAVQVVRAAQGGKGPRLSALAEHPGSGPPCILRHGPNAVLRQAALHPGPVLVDDPAVALLLRPALGTRVQVASGMTDALAEQIEALSHAEIALPGGLRASIVPTPALVAIDVDTAVASGVRAPKQAAQEAMNRAMLPALARQIRLRNLSGAILIDLAGLSVRRRAGLAGAVEAALTLDPLRPRFLGFTGLGLAEIMRPRVHPPLHEMLAGPHAAGLAALRCIAGRAGQPRIPVLRASPAIVSALESDPVALPALAHRLGRALVMRSDPGLAPGSWFLEDAPHA